MEIAGSAFSPHFNIFSGIPNIKKEWVMKEV
jgi:hypothetical protein